MYQPCRTAVLHHPFQKHTNNSQCVQTCTQNCLDRIPIDEHSSRVDCHNQIDAHISDLIVVAVCTMTIKLVALYTFAVFAWPNHWRQLGAA